MTVAPNPRTPWPYKPGDEDPEEVEAVARCLRDEFHYLDIGSDPFSDWEEIARVAIRALKGDG